MNNNNARRASLALGIFMAIVLVAGAILPLFTGNQQTTVTEPNTPPTTAPVPTFPPPVTDFTAVTFDQVYLHPTGIFSIGQPAGWLANEPNKGAAIAQVNLINNDTQSVVDTYVEDAGSITPADLDAHFSREAIQASWARFNQWSETARSFDEATGRLTIDFNVTSNRQQFVARQQAWTDGRWIYVVRVLTPDNATSYLRYLLDGFAASFAPNTSYAGTPLDWTAYYDPTYSHIIRYPATWALTDSAAGAPASITSEDGVALRVFATPGASVADEAAARAYVEGLRAGLTIASVAPAGDAQASGFGVAYTYKNVDGEDLSGYTVLLNGVEGVLHVADLRFPLANGDLNAAQQTALAAATAPEATPEAAPAEATPEVGPAEAPNLELAGEADFGVLANLADVMATFRVVPPIPVAVAGA